MSEYLEEHTNVTMKQRLRWA